MVEPWAIQLLGGFSARQGARDVPRFATRKTASLLALLAYRRGQAIPRETLLEMLWAESDLAAARNSLSVALSSLRAVLELPPGDRSTGGVGPGSAPAGPVLIADRSSITLNPDAFSTDVAAFESSARATDSAESLRHAIRLYTGELLPGFFDDWVFSERDRLADRYRQTLRRLTTQLIDSGAPDAALEYARLFVLADPLGEEARRLLMRVYADLGRPAAVREQLQELERRREEAGETPPSAETRWLANRLAESAPPEKMARSAVQSEGAAPTLAPAAPPVPATEQPTPTAPATPNNIPVFATRFFGREEELDRVNHLLSDPDAHLVTLTGPGGVGKTRLAVESARRAIRGTGWPGGVWFVPLADITESASIPEAVRDALRLPRQAKTHPLDQTAERLAGRPALLILDNLEHLLGGGPLDPSGASAAVRMLRERLPSVRLLATSRQVLGITGEAELPVPLLAVPADPSLSPAELLLLPSVQLFADRARARRVDFQVTPRNAETVARLVAKLEGIPLALELAAAWSKLLTPARMLERLIAPTSSERAEEATRFDLLTTRDANFPKRHRSLGAALEWGYSLLSPDARNLLAALSVFRGGWTVAAAQAVCEPAADSVGVVPEGRAMECLTALRDASLLTATDDGVEMRLGLLETVREFASGRLSVDERARVERQHAAYFRTYAEEAYTNRNGTKQKEWFDRLEADLPNLRAGMDRFAEEESALATAASLSTFWKIRGYYREGRERLLRVLAGPAAEGAAPTLLCRAWMGLGFLTEDIADYEAADEAYRRGESVARTADDEPGVSAALTNRGNLAYRRGEYAAARALYAAGLEIDRRRGDRRNIASTLGNLGNVAQAEDDLKVARRLQEESLALSREIGDDRMTAYTLHNLGNLALEEGDPERARSLYAESLPMKRALGDRRGVATLLTSMAFLEIQEAGQEAAGPLLRQALAELLDLGNRAYMLNALEGLAWCATRSGRIERAARLWAAASAARVRLSAAHTGGEQETFARAAEEARAAAPDAWESGSQMSLEDAAREALSDLVRPDETV